MKFRQLLALQGTFFLGVVACYFGYQAHQERRADRAIAEVQSYVDSTLVDRANAHVEWCKDSIATGYRPSAC